jgi:hypothetical protein
MAKVWDLQRRSGKPGDDWQHSLFSSKAKAWAAAAEWLREGFTIAGPYPRRVH